MRDYDLAATLTSGQAFRWQSHDADWAAVHAGTGSTPSPTSLKERRIRDTVQDVPTVAWSGVIGRRAVVLQRAAAGLAAEVADPVTDWHWLAEYLQTEVSLKSVLSTFPQDEPMQAAVRACHGLRLLRQEPWECLASFILSSTKQITQIRQIVAELCRRFGEPLAAIQPGEVVFSFPSAERLALCSEADLRACKAGFRAPYLLAAARSVASGECDLARLRQLPRSDARAELLKLPGVGPKIADCVLLFSLGFPGAFPLDVWVLRALGQLYFPRRRPPLRRLREFAATHFGPHAGYAQQYLFHYMRTHLGKRAQP